MADGLNRVILVGNLGMDPELRFTQNGTAVLRMRMATSETYFDRDKEKRERVEWHTVIVWGNRAEGLNKFLAKGHRLCIEGRLQTRQWEDRDGNKRSTTEIVATNVLALGGGGGQRDEERRDYRRDDPPRDTSGAGDYGDFSDDDIPF